MEIRNLLAFHRTNLLRPQFRLDEVFDDLAIVTLGGWLVMLRDMVRQKAVAERSNSRLPSLLRNVFHRVASHCDEAQKFPRPTARLFRRHYAVATDG